MEAIRTLKKVKNHQVLINLPHEYENAEVEIIVLLVTPIEEQQAVSGAIPPVYEKVPEKLIDKFEITSDRDHFFNGVKENLETAYQQMAKDEKREAEALEWSEVATRS